MKFCTFLLFVGQQVLSKPLCGGINGLVCCSGYTWNNKTETCTKCPVGYIGATCQTRCQYPTYGELCQQQCRCSRQMCDIATGCTLRLQTVVTKNKPHTTDRNTTFLYSNTNEISFSRNEDEKRTTNKIPSYNVSDKQSMNLVQLGILSLCIVIFLLNAIFILTRCTKTCSSRDEVELNKKRNSVKKTLPKGISEYQPLHSTLVYKGSALVNINYCNVNKMYSIEVNTTETSTNSNRIASTNERYMHSDTRQTTVQHVDQPTNAAIYHEVQNPDQRTLTRITNGANVYNELLEESFQSNTVDKSSENSSKDGTYIYNEIQQSFDNRIPTTNFAFRGTKSTTGRTASGDAKKDSSKTNKMYMFHVEPENPTQNIISQQPFTIDDTRTENPLQMDVKRNNEILPIISTDGYMCPDPERRLDSFRGTENSIKKLNRRKQESMFHSLLS